jgi:hypothetical protein
VAKIEDCFIELNVDFTAASSWLERLVRRLASLFNAGVRGLISVNLCNEFSRGERDNLVCRRLETVISGVFQSESAILDAPAAPSNVFRPVIELTNSPAAIGMKNYDPTRPVLAREYPGTDDCFRVWLQGSGGYNCGKHCQAEGESRWSHTPNEKELSHRSGSEAALQLRIY